MPADTKKKKGEEDKDGEDGEEGDGDKDKDDDDIPDKAELKINSDVSVHKLSLSSLPIFNVSQMCILDYCSEAPKGKNYQICVIDKNYIFPRAPQKGFAKGL